LLRSAGAGLAVAVVVGVLWRFIPNWEFYLCLLLGFGTVEAIARMAGNKRGADLQGMAILMVTIGFVIGRLLLAQRFGITFGEINALDEQVANPAVIQEFGRSVSVAEALRLQLVPSGIYALMTYLIAWVRFR
jgi:hypothetical protein